MGPTFPYAGPLVASLPPELRKLQRGGFTFTATWTPIAAGATTAVSFSIGSDAHFALVAISRTVFNVDNTTVVAAPPYLVLIKSSGSGRDLSDAPVHIENMAGTAQLPFVFPVPFVLTAGSQCSVTLTNLDPANARNVRMAFHGFKLFL